MSWEYGMLISVAFVFVPIGLGALWVAKREERLRQGGEIGPDEPEKGDVVQTSGLRADHAAGPVIGSDSVDSDKQPTNPDGNAENADPDRRQADAIARIKNSPPFLTPAEWEALRSYTGPVVSGAPVKEKPGEAGGEASGSE